MKKHLLIAAVLAVWFAVPAQAVQTSVTIDDPVVVTPFPGGMYSTTMTGTITLGSNDTFIGFRFLFTDPKGNTVAPTVNFTPPGQGQTSNYSMKTITSLKGNSTGEVDFTYSSSLFTGKLTRGPNRICGKSGARKASTTPIAAAASVQSMAIGC